MRSQVEDLASEWGEEEYLLRPKESLDGNIQNLQGVDIFVMEKGFEGVPQRRENRSVSVGGLRMWKGLNPFIVPCSKSCKAIVIKTILHWFRTE